MSTEGINGDEPDVMQVAEIGEQREYISAAIWHTATTLNHEVRIGIALLLASHPGKAFSLREIMDFFASQYEYKLDYGDAIYDSIRILTSQDEEKKSPPVLREVYGGKVKQYRISKSMRRCVLIYTDELLSYMERNNMALSIQEMLSLKPEVNLAFFMDMLRRSDGGSLDVLTRDLARNPMLPGKLLPLFKRLARIGLVIHESSPRSAPKVTFQVKSMPRERPEIRREQHILIGDLEKGNLVDKIHQYILTHPDSVITIPLLLDKLEIPEKKRIAVNQILQQWASNGYLEAGGFTNKIKGRLHINPGQLNQMRQIVEVLTDANRRYIRKDPPPERCIVTHKHIMREMLTRLVESRKEFDSEKVLFTLGLNANGISMTQIIEEAHLNLSPSTVRDNLFRLEKLGLIVRDESHDPNTYELVALHQLRQIFSGGGFILRDGSVLPFKIDGKRNPKFDEVYRTIPDGARTITIEEKKVGRLTYRNGKSLVDLFFVTPTIDKNSKYIIPEIKAFLVEQYGDMLSDEQLDQIIDVFVRTMLG